MIVNRRRIMGCIADDGYIHFEDPEVVRVLTTKGVIPEGGGITIEEASDLPVGSGSASEGWWANNTTIKDFDEIKYLGRLKNGAHQMGQWFLNATNLESVDLTGFTKLNGIRLFENCKNLEYFHGRNNTPNTLNLEDLTSLNASFNGCLKLCHITSLGSITSIGGSVFQNCTNLETVKLPNTITSVGDSAFRGCVKLTSIALLGSITSVEKNAFNGCTNLATINFSNTITSVGNNALNNTAWYNSQPDGPVYIAKVLYKCKNASGVFVIPNNIVSITEGAFYNQSSLTSVTIGSDVASIGNGAFRGCTILSAIVVDSSNAKYDSRDNCNAIIETLSNTLIAGCQNTIIPNSVTKINGSAFSDCRGLASIVIPNSVTSIGGRAFDFSGIDTSQPDAICLSGGITFGTGLTKIVGQTFMKAKFTALDLPANITTIENYAIDNCAQLQSIIMRGVTSIGNKAFRGSALTSITIETSSVPTISGTSFKNDNGGYINNGNFTIFVPSNLLSSYQTAPNWSTLFNDGKIQAIQT